MPRLTVLALMLATAATPAAAQDNAVKSAADAFGERVGTEQAGLYSETQVRGFDLNDSGAYRIDEAYFSRGAALNDPVLAGVGVRVGVNAARLAYPAPTGVVNYRLRQAGPVDTLRLTAGFRDFGTRVLQADGSVRSGDFSFAGGVIWRPDQRYAQGYKGKGLDVGGVGAWQISPDQRLRAFATVFARHYDGDSALLPSTAALPPSVKRLHKFSPSWALTKAVSHNVGVLYDGRIAGFTLDVAAFHSVFDVQKNDFTLISADAAGHATAVVTRAPDRPKRASSVEARLARQFAAGDFSHLVSVSLRGRRSTAELSTPFPTRLGPFDLLGEPPPEPPEPIWAGARGKDKVEQVTASVGYGLAWRDRVELRLAAHRTRYDKAFLSLAGAHSEGVSETTLYNASAIVSLTKRTAVFGSWVTGLEEAGSAPGSATNRDEVLPPVEAEQVELGVRHALQPGLTLIGAVFDISKPTNGLRSDGSFGLVGRVRHRGVEASVAGQLDDKTSLVVGAVAFQPKVSGPLVDAGIVGPRAAGVSHLVANANVERQLGGGWSVDAALNYAGERWGNTANTFKVPAVTTISVGARHRFELAGRRAELRVLASNLLAEGGYLVAPSGLLTPVSPRTARATLTVTLGPR